MTAPYTVAPFQRQVFVGNAGSTAGNQVLTTVEASVKRGRSFSDTTIRGDGNAIPDETEQPITNKAEITFKTRNEANGSNATMTANLIAYAVDKSNPICALLIKSYPGGPVEFDGDVTLEVDDPDARELEFTAHPTKQGGRGWSWS